MDYEDAAKHHLVRRFNEPSHTTMPGTHSPIYAQPCIELVALEKVNGATKRNTKDYWHRKIKHIQMTVFNTLERPRTTFSLIYHSFVFCLILASLFLSVLITIQKYEKNDDIQVSVYYLEVSLMIVFTIEYVLRLWSSSAHGNYKGFWGKLRFIRKPYMVIDIIVIAATAIVIATTKDNDGIDHFNVSMFRFLRFLQVLRILRLDRQRGAFKIVSHIFYEHRQELLTCWYMSFILLIACSFLVYLAEKSDDKAGVEKDSGEMEDLGQGIYWGMITLLTIGYGDIAPQNWMAKIITCIFAFIGTAFFALPAGILGSGFALQVAQNQKQKHFNQRRQPAAVTIQYAWRLFAAHPSYHSTVTWHSHQVPVPSKNEKRYSRLNGRTGGVHLPGNTSPGGTPQTVHKSMTYFRRKLHNKNVYPDGNGDTIPARRSSIGATIPSALELREHRSHSEGNLLLIGSNHVEDHQATIVSLPPAMLSEYTDSYIKGKNHHSLAGYYSSPDLQLKPLTHAEKAAIRFIRKVKLYIAIRKFKEECRPYDVKDVIEQYTEGQLDMFGFIKKFQIRVEGALGISGDVVEPEKTVTVRLKTVEKKIEMLDEKIDVILHLLNGRYETKRKRRNSNSPSPGRRFSHSSSADDILHIPHSMTGDSDSECKRHHRHHQHRHHLGVHPDELNRHLEKLKYTSGSSSTLDDTSTSSRSLASNAAVIDRIRADSRFTVTPTVLTAAGIDISITNENDERPENIDETDSLRDSQSLDRFELSNDQKSPKKFPSPPKSISFPENLSHQAFEKPLHSSISDPSTNVNKDKNNRRHSSKYRKKIGGKPPHSLSSLFTNNKTAHDKKTTFASLPEIRDNDFVFENKTEKTDEETGNEVDSHKLNGQVKTDDVDNIPAVTVNGENNVIVNPSFQLDC